jgi:hypothetical protein
MKFKLIKEPTEELFNIFKSYCLKSKPFDFCELPSMQMRIFKIREYFNNLFENCEIYIAEENGKILGFGGFRQEGDSVSADFVVGFNNFLSLKEISKMFFNFRSFYKKQNPHIKTFTGEVYRTYKVDSYLKFIKRYMGVSRIDLDKNPIMVYFDD